MANASILATNLADDGVVSADAEEDTMPASLLQVTHVRKRFRSSNPSVAILCDLGALADVDTVALLGLASSLGTRREKPSAAATVRLRISTVDATGAAGDALDTGVLASGSQWFDHAYGSLVWAGAAAVSGRYIRLDFADAGADYVEAGRLVAGERATFSANFRPGSGRGRTDLSRKTQTQGGQTLIERKARRRTLDLAFDWVTLADWEAIVEPIDRDSGVTEDILVILDAEADNVPQGAIWGLMADISPVSFAAIPDVFSKQYRIEERL